MKIGFIGVGAMGGPMSRNIVGKTNHEVTVFDLNPAAMEACVKAGAKRGESVAEVAAASEVIMLSLPTPKHVEAVIAGPDGIAENAKSGTVVIDLSTNSPGVIKRLGDLLSTKSIALIEAPVTGGVVKATGWHAHHHRRRRRGGDRQAAAAAVVDRRAGRAHRPARLGARWRRSSTTCWRCATPRSPPKA